MSLEDTLSDVKLSGPYNNNHRLRLAQEMASAQACARHLRHCRLLTTGIASMTAWPNNGPASPGLRRLGHWISPG
jgi:hypothetical protein